MMTIKRILVPTDFSEPSRCAVAYARSLAEAFGASLHVVHVLEDLLSHAWTAEMYVTSMPNMGEEIQKEALDRLAEIVPEADRPLLDAHVELLNGNPFVEICRYAEANRIDLIVMGTHGRGGIAHMLLGSVAEKVVRKAPCPVLVVREAAYRVGETEAVGAAAQV